MKKQDVVDLIEAHVTGNNALFINKAYEIANDFYRNGEQELANFIIGQLTPSLRMTLQNNLIQTSSLLKEIDSSSETFILPDVLSEQIKGIVNAVSKNIGISKFLFVGSPGTGKTEAVKQLGRVMHRNIYLVNFDELIDSRLGVTQKNISALFDEINRFSLPKKSIFLFDELDALALDRINSNDLREMGRATTSLLKGLDCLNRDVLLIATTNLQKNLDKAISRRFDAIINFDQYGVDDLTEVASFFVETAIKNGINIEKDKKLLRKIIANSPEKLTPGVIKNLMRTSIAFGDLDTKDYLRRFYLATRGEFLSKNKEATALRNAGFTLREIETLTLISKSELCRFFNEVDVNGSE